MSPFKSRDKLHQRLLLPCLFVVIFISSYNSVSLTMHYHLQVANESGDFTASGIAHTIQSTVAADSIPPKSVATTMTPHTLHSRFAYAYIVAGCNPDNPSYRNYLYNIMISTYNQRVDGSKAVVLVIVQLSFATEDNTLPYQDLRLLSAMNIKLAYIPKSKDESFYRTMLDKFLILRLTQFERVIFMDSDVMALRSLDYMFERSVQGLLQENVVMAGKSEPANGGFFMMAPKVGSWERLMEIIRNRERKRLELPYPHWNKTEGWGHAFGRDDYYQLINKRKFQTWEFHGDFADQGLLYHWIKYVEKSVSIVFRGEIQNWEEGEDGKVHLNSTVSPSDVFADRERTRDCWIRCDTIHFTGRGKPWLGGPPVDFDNVTDISKHTQPNYYWFHILGILNDVMDMGLNFSEWRVAHRPLLGMYPKHVHAAISNYSSTPIFEVEVLHLEVITTVTVQQ